MPICIAGMGRSGTSMCTQLLHHTGVHLGPEADLLPADPGNRDGYWENINFVTINDAVLRALGGAWDSPPPAADVQEVRAVLEQPRIEARQLIRQFTGHELWGWKDPRNSLTAPFWMDLIPGLRFIICVRNPLEVALSLRRRWGFSLPLSINLWRAYNTCLLAAVPPERRVVTHYDAYFAHAKTEVRHVLDALRIAAPTAAFERARAVVATDLRNTHFSMHDLSDAGIASDAIALYASLCAEAGWSDTNAATNGPTKERVDWDEMWRTVSTDPDQRLATQRYHEGIEQDRDNIRAYLADVERDRANVRAYLESVEQDRATLRDHLTRTLAYLEDVEQDRTNLRTYLADVEADARTVRAYLEDVERDRINVREYLALVERNRVSVRERLAAVEADDQAVRAHLEHVERDRTNVRAYLADVERDRATLRDHLTRARTYLEDVERDRINVRSYLADVERDRDDTRAHLMGVEEDRANMREHLAAVAADDRAVRAYLKLVEQDRTDVRAYLADVEQDRANVRAYVADVQRDYARMSGVAATHAARAAALEASVQDKERQIDQLHREMRAVQAQLERAERFSPRRLWGSAAPYVREKLRPTALHGYTTRKRSRR